MIDSERLDPDDARRLIYDIVAYMSRRAGRVLDPPDDPNNDSRQKDYYGDTWTFLYGIKSAMDLMKDDEWVEYDWESGEKINGGINPEGSWEDHYDQYGYGAYGRGLEIGRRLAYYQDRDFEITEEDTGDDRGFTINSYE